MGVGVLDMWPCPGCPVRRPLVHSPHVPPPWDGGTRQKPERLGA